MDNIYDNRELAKEACEKCNEELDTILEKYKVRITSNNLCCDIYLTTKYRDENGKIKEYSHY